ncbi:MAG: DNA methylase [Bacilli bacterium]|nr:DNA methylase [Bacilli bacterium]
MQEKVYIVIDLKSFYASVECVERSLNPLTTNLVVADSNRTSKTICLAVTPSLKQYGLSGRSRLYEVVQKVKEINRERRKKIKYQNFTNKSFDAIELKNNPNLELDYIIAKPRMSFYIEYSTKIYNIYLKYVSNDDMHVYSIDEVFIDATSYLKLYKLTPYEFALKIINDILKSTGITATAGIGPNMYLAKVAMDIVAKHIPENKDGVRIATLNVKSYRHLLWNHTPLTDFWRVGRGISKKLIENNIKTMGDIARTSIDHEEILYKICGIQAELLIDHAWGYEPCTISDIKKYKPKMNSISSGQVLHNPYNFKDAKVVVLEMTDSLVLELVEKNLVTKRIDLVIGYDVENINDDYHGIIKNDRYGRNIPKESHGFKKLDMYMSSTKVILDEISKIYDSIIRKDLSIRRITVTFNDVVSSFKGANTMNYQQLDLFTNSRELLKKNEELEAELAREKHIQKAIIKIQNKYGKNAMLKGVDLERSATARDRNNQIGGHAS